MIRLRDPVSKPSSFLSINRDVFQHSEPYRRTLSTLLLQILIFLWMLGDEDLHISFNIAKVWFALLMLVSISMLQSPVVVTLLPR